MESYNRAREMFRWSRPERFNFSRDVIDRWAVQMPDKLAMLWVDDRGAEIRRSYLDISTSSKRVANALSQLGVKRGDRLILMLGRQIAWWEVFTACLRMGVLVTPATTQSSSKDISYRVQTAEASCVICDSASALKFDRVAKQCPSVHSKIVVGDELEGWLPYTELLAAPAEFRCVDTAASEPALCYFSSGSSGHPKMCVHSHSYALGHETTAKYWLNLNELDMHWHIGDSAWAKAAWGSYFAPWLRGAAIFVHQCDSFDPERTLELMCCYSINTFCGTPTVYRMLARQDFSQYQFLSLRDCVSVGEPLEPELIDSWQQATGLTIRDGYGQTETVVLCGNFPGMDIRPGSMGKPSPGIELAVVDEQGQPLPPGVEGDIALRVKPEAPLGLFLLYKGEPEKTAASYRGDWYISGDRAHIDEDGYFWFVSRNNDVILSAGYRVIPQEVERALCLHQAVAEAVVVSSPDPQRGELVKAFVVLADGFEASASLGLALQNYVKGVSSAYKHPRKIEFIEALPKTNSGKIKRTWLQQREWKHHK
ncbi:MAG: AMP-binding protein [Cellvibrionaceae bacterium]|nr:AMP-binding protein [Cellvibrionaceae bacterium]